MGSYFCCQRFRGATTPDQSTDSIEVVKCDGIDIAVFSNQDSIHSTTSTQCSIEEIKQKVQEIYDIPQTASSPRGESAGNLIREQSDEQWTEDMMIEMQMEMSAELAHQRNSLTMDSLTMTHLTGSSITMIIPRSQSSHSMHAHMDTRSLSCRHIPSLSDSFSAIGPDADPELPIELKLGSDLAVHCESAPGIASRFTEIKLDSPAPPRNVFREQSAQQWSEAEVDAEMIEMAKQLVHLQVNMVSTKGCGMMM